MTRLILVIFTLLIVIAPYSANATTSRIVSLGGNGAFFEDEANAQRWYGCLGDYSNFAIAQSGRFNLPYGYHSQQGDILSGPGLGFHKSLGQNGNWGSGALYFNRINSDADPGNMARSPLGNTFSAIFSRKFKGINTGLVVRQSDSQSRQEVFGISQDNNQLLERDHSLAEFGGGFRFDISKTAYLDLAGEFRNTKIQETRTFGDGSVVQQNRVSGKNFNLRSRVFLQLGSKAALVPVTELFLNEQPLPSRLGERVESLDGRLFRVGCGLNYFPDSDKLLLLTVDYRNGLGDFRDITDPFVWTREWNSFNLGLGTETRFLPWLTLRGFWSYEHLSISESWSENVVISESFHDLDEESDTLRINLGAGVHIGQWDLDLALIENFSTIPSGYLGHEFITDNSNWISATLRLGL